MTCVAGAEFPASDLTSVWHADAGPDINQVKFFALYEAGRAGVARACEQPCGAGIAQLQATP
jgi:hypothetical protein